MTYITQESFTMMCIACCARSLSVVSVRSRVEVCRVVRAERHGRIPPRRAVLEKQHHNAIISGICVDVVVVVCIYSGRDDSAR